MKRFFVVIACVVFVTLAISGCATLFKGPSEEVTFNANRDAVDVYIDNELVGQAPVTVELKSDATYDVRFESDGETREVELSGAVGAGWIILDVFTGLIPVVIDIATGDWYELDNEISVEF